MRLLQIIRVHQGDRLRLIDHFSRQLRAGDNRNFCLIRIQLVALRIRNSRQLLPIIPSHTWPPDLSPVLTLNLGLINRYFYNGTYFVTSRIRIS